MTPRLIELKQRAERLRYNDKKELDDILRKAKLYISKAFPDKFSYTTEVDTVSFYPSFFVSGMGSEAYMKSWNSGKEELINILDTRIEELQLEIEKPVNTEESVRVVEKLVPFDNTTRIKELTQELNTVKASKSLWERINYAGLTTISISLVGGSFLFGKYFGENRFDKEKIQLLYDNNNLKESNDSLKKRISELKNWNELNVIHPAPEIEEAPNAIESTSN